MVEKDVTVKNRAGIHARPAGMIVTLANKYASQIFIEKDNDKINAKSISEEVVTHPVVQHGYAVKIGLHRIPGERLKGGLGTEHSRRPVRLWIEPAQQSKHWSAQLQR